VENLKNTGAPQKVLEWITLFLAMLFFILGVAILSGLFLGDHIFFQGAMRIPIGLVLVGYGIIRGGMILRRMSARKKRGGGD
jgi:hypothetical protein